MNYATDNRKFASGFRAAMDDLSTDNPDFLRKVVKAGKDNEDWLLGYRAGLDHWEGDGNRGVNYAADLGLIEEWRGYHGQGGFVPDETKAFSPPPIGFSVAKRGGKRRRARPAGKAKHAGQSGATLFYAREDPKQRWKHLMAISDGRLVLFEMVPAILAGWNCERTTVQGDNEWGGMGAASILAFKQQSGDKLLRPATSGEVEWMQSKLAATGGKRRHAKPTKRAVPVKAPKPAKQSSGALARHKYRMRRLRAWL